MDDSKPRFDIAGGNEIAQCLFRMGMSNWPTVCLKTVLRGEVTEEGPAPCCGAKGRERRHTTPISRCPGKTTLIAAITL